MAVVRFEIEDSLTALFIPQLKIQAISRASRFSLCVGVCTSPESQGV